MKNKNKFKDFLFKKKEVIIISNNTIKSKKVGFANTFVGLCGVVWLSYTSFFYFKNQEIIRGKDNYIKELTVVNNELKNNLNNFNEIFNNIEDYVSSLNLYDRFDNINTADFKKRINIINDDFLNNKSYNEVLPVLAKVDDKLNNIDNLLNTRISNMEQLVADAGINKKELNNIHTVNFKNSTKKYNSEEYIVSKNSVVKKTNFDTIAEKVNYLSYLEAFIDSMPVGNPMNNYRITSNFGDRPDPFERNTRFHRGIDLAAPLNSKVSATANGRVVFAGKKNGYGNYVKLAHNNSMTTEYAHLKNIKVKVGDFVERGDTLGLQGNTGRSTGDHLHYEVRFDNKVKNPKDFINIGNRIFN